MAIKKKKENEVSAVLTPIRSNTGYSGQSTAGQKPSLPTAQQTGTPNVQNLPFASPLTQRKNEALGAYLNREPFKYDFNADALYQHYKDAYVRQGQQAMQDTMGQAAALTGGYGSSYAQNVGQQAYNQHLTQLNDVVPELYRMAYEKYQNEGNELLQRYGLLADEEAQDYSRWYQAGRDAVADQQWQQSFDYQKGRDTVADQRYNDETAYKRDQENAIALAYAGDYSGIAKLHGMTNEQAAAYAAANGYTSMTEEKAAAMALTGDYSGIATLHGMTDDQAKAWAQANGITPESYAASQMTEEKAMAMAANGDYSGIAQWLSVPVDYAKAWYIKEYGDPTAEEPIEKPTYSRQDLETGNYIFYYDGKEVEHEKGISPITGNSNPDIQYGTFGNTGYQPDNIGGVKLEKAGFTDIINGHEQNVWRKTDDGSFWMWDDLKTAYVEYDKPVAVDTDGVKRFEQTLYDDYGYRTASDKSKKGIAENRIMEWLDSGRITDAEADTLIAKYVL
jgi:hypothetical protein